jgi:lichenan operon transcriptional antiterminator
VLRLLNERQERIIILLKDNKSWMNGKELSGFLDVSDRTIRSDIEYINRHNNALIESNIRNGYRLNVNIVSNLNTHSETVIPQTSSQRCTYILRELMFKKNELNLVYLMDKVFVSDYSIENDLRQLKKMIEPYPELKIVRSKKYIHFEGNEQYKRQFYKDLIMKEMKGNFLNFDRLAYLFTNFDLLVVKDLLEETFNKYNYYVREIEIPALLIYIGITIERIISHNYIQKNGNTDNNSYSIEYVIAKDFYEKVSRKLNIIVVEDEILLVAMMLLGEKEVNGKEAIIYLKNSNYTVIQLIIDILQDFYIKFDVDFRKDEDLKVGLSSHIQLLLERKKKNIDIPNMYLDEIKRKYPLLFEMAVRVREILQDKLNVAISENDISFIAQHLGGAFERKDKKNKYRVLTINPNNQALSSLCVRKLVSSFHERMEIVESINYFEKKKVLTTKPDLILTTLPLEHDLDILTVQISIFVNAEDESKIFQALNLLDSNGFKAEFALSVKTMMESQFFYLDLDLDTPKKVVSFISDELYHAGLVEEDFKDAVLKREDLSPTSFVYSFAVPHPLNVRSKKSKIAVALLKKPIQWGDFKVKLVLLLATREDEQKVLCTFFDWLSNMVNDSKKLSSLMNVKSYEEFIKKIIV